METPHAVDRLATKNPQEAIIAEIQRDFNLTRIFAKAHFDQMERYFREHTALDLAHGQIAYEAVAVEEPAGKPLRDCRRIMVKLTLVDPAELETLRNRGLAAVRQARLLRMATEAHEQGALLTVEDLAFLTTRLVPIKLNLVADEDHELLAQGASMRERQKIRIHRLFLEAYEQDALLTNLEVGILIGRSEDAVNKVVREYRGEGICLTSIIFSP